ncbi:MAG: hypothetical protein FWG04_06415 [Desulfovibrionaceae bacterium]|nr:hypothetical protein [Desulfovibrionaceae bacterium]
MLPSEPSLASGKHIVFVAAGYPAIGMGHVYRTLMLARELHDFRVSFLLTRESESFAFDFVAPHYPVSTQSGHACLASEVLSLKPDLVINDILATDASYIGALKATGLPVVNFEDDGPGADLADLVVNALYESKSDTNPHRLYGHRYFCLRDEFLKAEPNVFRSRIKRVLVTFGGTDASDFTSKTLDSIFDLCRDRAIAVSVVAGPGYAHREALESRINELDPGAALITFTHATNVMSREMEQADIALCSAGRTVYELAHMRIPAIVLAHHEREDMHTFARPRNGFVYLGVMRDFRPERVVRAFSRLLDPGSRHPLYDRLCRFDFRPNKARVIARIQSLLPKT